MAKLIKKNSTEGYSSHSQGGVDDYTDKGDFNTAYSSARKAGKKEFMWNNKRYNTNYKGTPEQQLKETGITDKQRLSNNFIRDRIENNLLEYKPYTAVQDNTYVAPRVVIPLEQKKKQQFVPREQPVLKADTRTEQQRKIAQEYTEAVSNPPIRTQIGEALQKPLRWLADPVKGVGDIVSALAPNSALAKDLPNTNEDIFEYRKKQLSPYTSNKEKINNTINEAIPLTNWALLNTLPIEATGNMIKSGKNLIKPVSKVVNKTDDVSKNLKDLEYAKDYYSKYGYNIPENLAEIAKNSKLTDETIQGLVNQHNTFVRGVSTNWDEIAKKNPEILRHLEGKGIDYINNPQAAAEYMSTHVPIQTGYGRAGLNENIFREGKDAIYTSNSIPTAEGYTYGDGYIVKVKRPTDFSSKNRIDWINSNKLDYFEDNLKTAPKEIKDKFLKLTDERYIKEIEPKYFDKNGNWKNGKVLQKELAYDDWVLKQEIRQELGLSVEKQHNLLKHEGSNKTNLNKILDENTYPDLFIGKLDIQNKDFHLKNLDEITKTIGKKYNTIRFNLENKISDLPSNSQLRKQLIQDINNIGINAIKEIKTEQLNYLKKNFPKEINEVDRYAHYLHIGTPGQKLLEPIEAIRITPDIWKNKSRAHTNVFSKGLSAGSLIPFYLYSQSQNQSQDNTYVAPKLLPKATQK